MSWPREVIIILCAFLFVSRENIFGAEAANNAISWLALGIPPKMQQDGVSANGDYWERPQICKSIPGMVNGQVTMCQRNIDVMASVGEAAEETVRVCQENFSGRRWNCSSIELAPNFTPDIEKSTRESGYVHALAAAALAQAVAKDCSAQKIAKCGCGLTQSQTLDEYLPAESDEQAIDKFVHEGCSDNTVYGIEFTQKFIGYALKGKKTRNRPKTSAILHNIKAGLLAMEKSSELTCRCHGVTGSCTVQTCWLSLPDLMKVGQVLKQSYAGATQVVSIKSKDSKGETVSRKLGTKHKNHKAFTENDLIYLTSSPDYCRANPKTGSLGTKGRSCNQTSQANDGCELLCCGRGYNSYREEIQEQCQCKIHWCCSVKCKTCTKHIEVHKCK